MDRPRHVSGTALRVRPRAWIGIALWVVYVAVILLVQGTSGVPYTELADTVGNIWRNGVLSIVLAAAAVVLIGWRLGWLRAAIVERPRSRARWTLLAPLLYLAIAIGNAVATDWSALSVGFVLSAVVLGVVVGFGEEITCRGLLLVGLRGSTREVFVWLLTCVLFGLMHGLNIVLGAAVGDTVQQVVLAAMQGSAFYVLRRVTGSLVWAMALHGFWDFSIFTQSTSGADQSSLGILMVPAALLSVVAAFFVTRDAGRERDRDEALTGG
ncbi:CPBP family intramembrane glutamic endopeptidase [Isoptericola aurantiacus]|uniref:CPBP family intramembrane glutamic endopeptidase n=1 Tax=Isoptericola aurantiacus TaxID=3377839 RepID=UPI00383BEACE